MMDSIYPTNVILVPACGKDKKRTAARQPHAGRTSIRDVMIMFKWRHRVASKCIQDFGKLFYMFSNIKCGI